MNGCPGIGYEYEFLAERSVLEDFTCFVCRLVARNPQQVNCCGQIVCENCLQKWKQQRHECHLRCPHCNQQLKSFEDKNCHQKITSLKVRCSYTAHGCSWVGELMVLETHHINQCVFQVAPCPDCNDSVPKKRMKHHSLHECRKRRVKCPNCPCEGTYEFVHQEHKLQCKYWPVQCPSGCGLKVLRGGIEEHRETCMKEIVKCRYFENGCQVMVLRAELAAHENECPKKLTATGHSTLTRGQLRTIEQNEQSTVAPLMVALRNFKQQKQQENQVWESQPFYTAEEGYRICLRVYANGCSTGSCTHLSCYIHLVSGYFDDQRNWPFQGIVTVSLRNQTEDCNHFEKEFKFLTCQCTYYNSKPEKDSTNPFGIGDPQFINLNDLEEDSERNIQYLKNDCLVFQICYNISCKPQLYCQLPANAPFPY